MTCATIIETARLKLRGWQEKDRPDFIRMNADPEVMRFFPEPWDEALSLNIYDRIQLEFAESGYGLYVAEEKRSGSFMGFIGFHRADLKTDFCPCIEIAWRLNPRFWNQGYATEGAGAALAHGFDQLDFERVYSFTARLNLPSQRVMQKIGMRWDRYFDHPDLPPGHPLTPHVCYVAIKGEK